VLGTKRPKGDHPGTRQTPGLPDLYVFLPNGDPYGLSGRPPAVWIEVKARDGRMRRGQRTFRDCCASRGIPHIVGGLDDVLAFLRHWAFCR
jgi:hypothetical protein